MLYGLTPKITLVNYAENSFILCQHFFESSTKVHERKALTSVPAGTNILMTVYIKRMRKWSGSRWPVSRVPPFIIPTLFCPLRSSKLVPLTRFTSSSCRSSSLPLGRMCPRQCSSWERKRWGTLCSGTGRSYEQCFGPPGSSSASGTLGFGSWLHQ